MTQVVVRPDNAVGAGAPAPPPAAGPRNLAAQVAPTAAMLLAILLFAFVLEMSVAGAVRHARDQDIAYRALRSDFATRSDPPGSWTRTASRWRWADRSRC